MNPLKSIFSATLKNKTSMIGHGALFGVNVYSAMSEETTEEKVGAFGRSMLINQLAHHPSALISLAKGMGLEVGLTLAGAAFKQGGAFIRSGLEARTSMGIPFSHSSLNMQMAAVSAQNARQRVNRAYGTLGSEATIFAARYMRR